MLVEKGKKKKKNCVDNQRVSEVGKKEAKKKKKIELQNSDGNSMVIFYYVNQ